MNNLKSFLSLNNLKKVNKELNDFIDSNKHEDGKLVVSWQGFVENQYVGYARNGASSLVDLQKILYECESIDLVRPNKLANYSFLDIYVKASAHAGQGCRDLFSRLRIKDKKGIIHTLSDVTVETLQHKFGRVYAQNNLRQAVGSNVIQFKTVAEVEKDISEEVYQDMVDVLKYHSVEKFSKKIQEQGYEFVDVMEYTHKFSIYPTSIKVLKNKISLTYMTNGTYNSLPVIVTIEKMKKINEISLASLGIEEKGYYSHHDKMTILPEQEKEAMDFYSEFKKLNK